MESLPSGLGWPAGIRSPKMSVNQTPATENRDLETALAKLPAAEAFAGRLVARFSPFMPLSKGATVLDIGAAEGVIAAAYALAGFTVRGVEPWPPALETSFELAARADVRYDIRHAYGEQLPFDTSRSIWFTRIPCSSTSTIRCRCSARPFASYGPGADCSSTPPRFSRRVRTRSSAFRPFPGTPRVCSGQLCPGSSTTARILSAARLDRRFTGFANVAPGWLCARSALAES
jgi:hypothetical protein